MLGKPQVNEFYLYPVETASWTMSSLIRLSEVRKRFRSMLSSMSAADATKWFFSRNAKAPLCDDWRTYAGVCRRCRSYKVRQSYISRTIWLRIIIFYKTLHTRRAYGYNHTGYDVTSYFRSESSAKNSRKGRLRWLWVEFQWRAILPPHKLVGFLFGIYIGNY